MAENERNTEREGGLTVYVDDQPVIVDEAEITIRRLLELSGAPADAGDSDAVLRELRDGKEIKHEDLEETITVTDEARFYTRNATPETMERPSGSFRSEASHVETATTPKSGAVNTSTFGEGGKSGGSSPRPGGNPQPGGPQRNERPTGAQPGTAGSTNPSREQPRTPNVGGQAQPGSPGQNVAGRTPNAQTAPQRGSTTGSNVASGTGVNRETVSGQRGTNPNPGVQDPRVNAQPGSSVPASKTGGAQEQQRHGFNEGQNQQPGARRTSERKEGRPAERKTEEQET